MPYSGTSTYPSDDLYPGAEAPAMPQIRWNQPEDRSFETGLDRGVLYPKGGAPAVPWNGLTSVDENGAESSSAYYIDGRPFLFLPKPKEFAATLKAYTYPDAFAAIMGLAEAAPGMYLDSQQSDSFDLSYRTLVGNGLDQESGYKLHLVYNATVVPQGSSYQSLAGSINPTEFSWNIETVPVPVAGYRPTAHIVIDTRHLNLAQLHTIEALLYGATGASDEISEPIAEFFGDTLSAPAMPSPQVVYDILTYGESIVIIDNGDTWQAEGSYQNIYMIGDGIFEIDNVDAVDNGDGTFDISSTP